MNKRQLAAMAAAAMMLICMPTTAFAALGRPGQPSASVQQQVKSERKVIKKNAKETEEETAKWQQQMLESVNLYVYLLALPNLSWMPRFAKLLRCAHRNAWSSTATPARTAEPPARQWTIRGVSYSWWGENINEEQDNRRLHHEVLDGLQRAQGKHPGRKL